MSKGCRPYTQEEYEALKRVAEPRDRCMLVLGVRTGFRIMELLSLNVEDVVGDYVCLKKRNTKGKIEGRISPITEESKVAIRDYVGGRVAGPLFLGRGGKRLGRISAWESLCKLHSRASIRDERLGTHSMRKTFAKNMYEALSRDILKLQTAMGHKSIDSTSKYIEVNTEEIWNAIRKM